MDVASLCRPFSYVFFLLLGFLFSLFENFWGTDGPTVKEKAFVGCSRVRFEEMTRKKGGKRGRAGGGMFSESQQMQSSRLGGMGGLGAKRKKVRTRAQPALSTTIYCCYPATK